MNIQAANRLTPYMFLAPAAAVMIIALLYPIGYMVYASFLDWNPSQRIGEAEFVGLRNYINLWNSASFWESFGVTIRFAALVVSLEMFLGVGLALLLDRQLRGMAVLRTIFILPMMIAPIVVGLMWRYITTRRLAHLTAGWKHWASTRSHFWVTAAGPLPRSSLPTSGSGRRSFLFLRLPPSVASPVGP